MSNIYDYIGEVVWNATVIGVAPKEHFNSKQWIFKCNLCGKEFIESPSKVLSGHKKSCGCGKREAAKTHNCNTHPLYHTWWSMIQRCYNPKNHNYSRYGERGITVCDAWRESPISFIEWADSVGGRPVGMTLDRINNDQGYSPENCRWVSMKVQSNNRSSNTLYTIGGVTKTFTQWCEYYGISDDVVWERIHKLHWDIQEAFQTPISFKNARQKLIEINGKTMSISAWCKAIGASHSTVYKRISDGFSPSKAIMMSAKRTII